MSQALSCTLEETAINFLQSILKGKSITFINPQIATPPLYKVINVQPYISTHTLRQLR